MDDSMEISSDDVAEVPPNAAEPTTRTVTVHCDDCDVDTTIEIPLDHADARVTWEHACSNTQVFKGVWLNPDVLAPITAPGPDDDVIWDAAQRAYVPRVVQVVGETGASGESADA